MSKCSVRDCGTRMQSFQEERKIAFMDMLYCSINNKLELKFVYRDYLSYSRSVLKVQIGFLWFMEAGYTSQFAEPVSGNDDISTSAWRQ